MIVCLFPHRKNMKQNLLWVIYYSLWSENILKWQLLSPFFPIHVYGCLALFYISFRKIRQYSDLDFSLKESELHIKYAHSSVDSLSSLLNSLPWLPLHWEESEFKRPSLQIFRSRSIKLEKSYIKLVILHLWPTSVIFNKGRLSKQTPIQDGILCYSSKVNVFVQTHKSSQSYCIWIGVNQGEGYRFKGYRRIQISFSRSIGYK